MAIKVIAISLLIALRCSAKRVQRTVITETGALTPFHHEDPPVELTRPALRRVEASRNKGNKKLVGSLALSVGRSVGCARVFAWDLHEEKILANQNRARTVCNALSSRRFDGKPVSSCQDSVLPCNRRRVKVPCTIP